MTRRRNRLIRDSRHKSLPAALAVTGLLVVLGVVGCGAAGPNGVQVQASGGGPSKPLSAPPPSVPYLSKDMAALTSNYSGRLATPKSYKDISLTLEVPSSKDVATLPWAAAFSTCAGGGAMCFAGTPVGISLAKATDLNTGSANADGSISPALNKTLVYLLKQSNIACRPTGGPAGLTTTSVAASVCTVLNFVDANTGKVLFIVESPGL